MQFLVVMGEKVKMIEGGKVTMDKKLTWIVVAFIDSSGGILVGVGLGAWIVIVTHNCNIVAWMINLKRVEITQNL